MGPLSRRQLLVGLSTASLGTLLAAESRARSAPGRPAGGDGGSDGRLVSDPFIAGEGGYSCYRTPGLAITQAGTVLAFCKALGDFGITLMVAGDIPGRTQTLPLAIYDHVQANDLHQANILSLVSIGFVILLMLAFGRAARLRY